MLITSKWIMMDIKFDIVIGPRSGRGYVHVTKKERRRLTITRYDYNLTIMKSQISQTGH
jgi:hypothetical protein